MVVSWLADCTSENWQRLWHVSCRVKRVVWDACLRWLVHERSQPPLLLLCFRPLHEECTHPQSLPHSWLMSLLVNAQHAYALMWL